MSGHLEPCQTPISGHDVPISVYSDIEPDIGYDIADTRYRVFPDIGIPDIGTYPKSGTTVSRYRECPDIGNPDIGTNIGIYRYQDQHFPMSIVNPISSHAVYQCHKH